MTALTLMVDGHDGDRGPLGGALADLVWKRAFIGSHTFIESVVDGRSVTFAGLRTAVIGWDHEVLGRVPVAYGVARGVSVEGDRAGVDLIVRRVQDGCRSGPSHTTS